MEAGIMQCFMGISVSELFLEVAMTGLMVQRKAPNFRKLPFTQTPGRI